MNYLSCLLFLKHLTSDPDIFLNLPSVQPIVEMLLVTEARCQPALLWPNEELHLAFNFLSKQPHNFRNLLRFVSFNYFKMRTCHPLLFDIALNLTNIGCLFYKLN